jgi:hypothetical protein
MHQSSVTTTLYENQNVLIYEACPETKNTSRVGR